MRWGDTWGAATDDIDLWLTDVNSDLVVGSFNEQSGLNGRDPVEFLTYTAASTGWYFLRMEHFAGGTPSWVQVMSLSGRALQTATANRSIRSPGDSSNVGMRAVGASNWATPTAIESFSSQGPTIDGRVKPDIVGADGGDAVSYPGGFFGTSPRPRRT